ncbi:hypothetical protein BJV77DRAFT_964477 [Russula vinacea]|nr:hypothetical protein BJV77DRAFT_964477 [Russula vinacea]
MSLRYSNMLEHQFGVAKPGACQYFGLGMFIDRMGSFKPDYKTMSSKASLYTEAVHQTEDAMSSHCWYIPRSLAHIVTPSHTHRPDAPHLQASTHMQGNASKRPGAGGVEQWGGRGVADAACEEGLQTLRAGGGGPF